MSPEPNLLKVTNGVTNKSESTETKADGENNAATSQTSDSIARKPLEINNAISMTNVEGEKRKDALNNTPASSFREKRNASPTSCALNDNFLDPQSPSSSSCTSQATSANDATFEPTIEMMVNDFDDEQTLNEEEALASLESQDPDEEIDTLKKESEMPLEELLAKYRAMPPLPPPSIYSDPPRKKSKKTAHKVKQRHKQENASSSETTAKPDDENEAAVGAAENAEITKASSENFDEEIGTQNRLVDVAKAGDSNENSVSQSVQAQENQSANNLISPSEINKVRRSHLLDLYPEGTFDAVVVGNEITTGDSKDIFYGVEDDEEEEDEEIEEDDEDYKKKVMIGTSYQATIPTGLSQYGDILPYENEDKLIWEPSQVSEREVEEYLIKIRDIKSNQQTEVDENAGEINSDDQSKENGRSENNADNLENNSLLANSEALTPETATTTDMENQAVVKDNEQALHLLVQCGYDFKEALRRKRLNALPLNDCMSLWSEEECHKFEEGIQKFGKDFLRIRQNQVRTRTMRELVQFYYLWKKSERRDHNFANADTVDHMDIYLNEDNDYGSNPSAVVTPLSSPVGNNSNATPTGKNLNASQKNISIMTTTATTLAVTNTISEKNLSNTCLQQHLHQTQHHKRRAHSSNPAASNLNGDTSSNTSASASK